MQPSSVSYRKTPCQILRSNSVYIFNKLASKLSNEPSRRNLPTLACDVRRNRQRSQCDGVGAANVEPLRQRHDYVILTFCLFLLLRAKLNDDVMSFSSRCWLNRVHVISVTRMR
uniref:Putative conserved protein with signal anchor n=1 Tax=Ixodes ricinus TaxID=34613 RepID=A0A131XSB7_IXORI